MKTLGWLWGMILNPSLVWVDQATGEVADVEKVPRFGGDALSRWDMRPMWFHYFLTTNPGCGCRKRLGIWQTIICGDHVSFSLDDD